MTLSKTTIKQWGFVFFLILFFGFCSTTWSAETSTRPNILFIMVDQMRGDCLGANGNPVIRTPNLDRLAREGVRFEHAYTCTPSCGPARSALLTGLAPWNHGLLGAGGLSSGFEKMMPQILTDAGYQTVGIGSAVFKSQGFQSVQRFSLRKTADAENDYLAWFKQQAPNHEPDETGLGPNSHRGVPFALPEHLHHTQWIGDRTVDFLKSYGNEKPFFLMTSFFSPHSPYDAPKRYWDMYENADIPKRIVGDWAEKHAQRGKKHADDLWQGDLGEEAARKARIGYYGNITFIDDQVGRMIKTLEDRGILENTFILFISDHGDMLGDHHLWRKTYPYESSVRIPLLMRLGKAGGRRPEAGVDAAAPLTNINAAKNKNNTDFANPVDLPTKNLQPPASSLQPHVKSGIPITEGLVLSQPVEIRDVLPTFLDVAHVEYQPQSFDGRSLLNLVRDPDPSQTPWREFIDLEHATCYDKNNNWTALTDGKTKYIFYATEDREELFDLIADPHELHDLSATPQSLEKLVLWRQRMIDHLSERGENYVKDGKLSRRPKGITYSPNHPSKRE